jgi:hypothetical protein
MLDWHLVGPGQLDQTLSFNCGYLLDVCAGGWLDDQRTRGVSLHHISYCCISQQLSRPVVTLCSSGLPLLLLQA